MNRVRVLVEDQTEQAFIKEILQPHFDPRQIYLHAVKFRRQGGITPYERAFKGFKKTIDGISAAERIGLETMRRECPHFNEWITKLEDIGKQ